jgi:hypothetical protein
MSNYGKLPLPEQVPIYGMGPQEVPEINSQQMSEQQAMQFDDSGIYVPEGLVRSPVFRPQGR